MQVIIMLTCFILASLLMVCGAREVSYTFFFKTDMTSQLKYCHIDGPANADPPGRALIQLPRIGMIPRALFIRNTNSAGLLKRTLKF